MLLILAPAVLLGWLPAGGRGETTEFLGMQPVGKDYDTVVDNRPKTITTADGKVYELVPQGNYPVGNVDGEGHLTTTEQQLVKLSKVIRTLLMFTNL